MSLLSRPPHRVDVQLRATVTDSRGKSVLSPSGAPITSIPVSVQPLSSADRLVLGGVLSDTMRTVFARTWPGDINSSVSWDGYDWDTYGDPQHFSMSPATDHYEIRILKRGVHGSGV